MNTRRFSEVSSQRRQRRSLFHGDGETRLEAVVARRDKNRTTGSEKKRKRKGDLQSLQIFVALPCLKDDNVAAMNDEVMAGTTSREQNERKRRRKKKMICFNPNKIF